MSTRFFADPVNTVAHYWRIYRKDGIALGFVTHDRDLCFGGMRHRAAPGLVPSAIRLSGDLGDDEAGIEGALSHNAVREDELAAGRYDGAEVELGLVDWETLAGSALYRGTIAQVTREGSRFSATLASGKAAFARDPIPRTGPACRAEFCGPGCNLNPRRFERAARIVGIDRDRAAVQVTGTPGTGFVHGTLRFLEGSPAGDSARILAVSGQELVLDRPLPATLAEGARVRLREGCDRTIATCDGRFANAVNFRGEPHLPGTDLLAQYPVAR